MYTITVSATDKDGDTGPDTTHTMTLSQSPTITINADTLTDSQFDNVIVVTRQVDNIYVTVDGVEIVDTPMAGVPDGLIINGQTGNDTLTVDYTGGDITIPIVFDGGTDDDALRVIGDGTDNATYTPDAAVTGNGIVSIAANEDITFTGLEPVDITGMGNVTVSLPGGNDDLTITEGVDSLDGTTPALVVSGTTDGTVIETAHLFGNTHVTIDTTTSDGDDTITIASGANAHANVGFRSTPGQGLTLSPSTATPPSPATP